jgi:hypothetical protein
MDSLNSAIVSRKVGGSVFLLIRTHALHQNGWKFAMGRSRLWGGRRQADRQDETSDKQPSASHSTSGGCLNSSRAGSSSGPCRVNSLTAADMISSLGGCQFPGHLLQWAGFGSRRILLRRISHLRSSVQSAGARWLRALSLWTAIMDGPRSIARDYGKVFEFVHFFL